MVVDNVLTLGILPFFLHKADNYIEKGDFKGMERMHILGGFVVKSLPRGIICCLLYTSRLKDAKNIEISKEHKPKNIRKKVEKQEKLHPGYGEGGKFHNRKEETPLPEGETLTFALVGNQNCGKTTLFNQLTGSKQHVGNFPGCLLYTSRCV